MRWRWRGWLAARAPWGLLCAGGMLAALTGLGLADAGRVWAQAGPTAAPAATATPRALPSSAPAVAPPTGAGSEPAGGAPPAPTASGAAGDTAASSGAGAPGNAPPASAEGAAASAGATPDAGTSALGGTVAPSAPGDSAPNEGSAAGSAGTDAAAVAPAGPASAAPAVAPPNAAAEPVARPEAVAGAGRVLYADGFANAASGWPVQSSDPTTRRVGYVNGEYAVARLPGSGGSPYVMREERFGDFLLEVDARLLEPTADAYVFVDFRRQESGEHYSFVVAPDEGAFIVRRNTDRDGVTVLDWTRSAAIQGGTATNRLGVRARGGEVTLLVNGEEVGRARADELPEGGFGFGVGSLSDGAAEARFANLVVTSVEPSPGP